MTRRRWQLFVGIAAATTFASGIGCSDDAAPTDADSGPLASDAAVACNKVQRHEDGTCCPAGTFYDFETNACAAVGPPGCDAHLPEDPVGCVPRWCGDWKTAQGAACKGGTFGCLLTGRACTKAELSDGKGCPAGQWRTSDGASCVVVGPRAGFASTAATTDDLSAHGLPPLPAKATPTVPRWCWDGQPAAACATGATACLLQPRACTDEEREQGKGCLPGTSPRVDGADGWSCQPAGVDWICPVGFVPVQADTSSATLPPPCVPDPNDCPADKWGTASKPGVIHVDAAASPGGDGTAKKPFASLDKAWSHVVAGDVVLMAKGSYDPPSSFGKGVTLRGVCAAHVRLSRVKSQPVIATNSIGSPEPLVIERVHLAGPRHGIAVQGSWQVIARQVFIDKPTSHGAIGQGSKAQLALQDCVIRGARMNPTGANGGGVAATSGARVTVVRTRISASARWALVSDDALLHAEDVLIDRGNPDVKTTSATVQALELGRVVLRRVTLAGVRDVGLNASAPGASIYAEGVSIRDMSSPHAGLGRGIVVQDKGRMVVAGATIARARTHAASVLFDSRFVAAGLAITDTRPDPVTKRSGEALIVVGAAEAVISGSVFRRNRAYNLAVDKAQGAVRLTDVLIDDTREETGTGNGTGLYVNDATVLARRLFVRDSREYGVLVYGKKARLAMVDAVVQGAMPSLVDKGIPAAINVQLGRVELTGVRLTENWLTSLVAKQQATVRGAGVLIDRPKPGMLPDGKGGHLSIRVAAGLTASSGADVAINGLRLAKATLVGAQIIHPGTRLHTVGAALDRTGPDDIGHRGGIGLDVVNGAQAGLEHSLIAGSHTAGIFASEHNADPKRDVSGGDISLDGTVVRSTAPAIIQRGAKKKRCTRRRHRRHRPQQKSR